MDKKIRVVIIDDHTLFRKALVEVLSRDSAIEVVGEGATAQKAISLTKRLQPDILLLDLAIPGGGFAAAEALVTACPATRIIVVTSSQSEDDVDQASRVGVHGYVLKGISGNAMIKKIHEVYQIESPRLPSSK